MSKITRPINKLKSAGDAIHLAGILIHAYDIELNLTRNLLARVLDEHSGRIIVERKTLTVDDSTYFDTDEVRESERADCFHDDPSRCIVIRSNPIVTGITTSMQSIAQLRKELGL